MGRNWLIFNYGSLLSIDTNPEPDARQSFVADHPFLFFIQDDEGGAVPFMGKITDPMKQISGTAGKWQPRGDATMHTAWHAQSRL